MLFDKLAIALISPLGTSLVLGVLALVAGAAGSGRWAFGLGLAGLLWLGLWSMPAVSYALRSQLETAYPAVPESALPVAQALVVLGGGVAPPDVAQDGPDLLAGADRVWYAARLFHAGKAPLVLLSGGRVLASQGGSEARAMQVFLRDLGVPDGAMLLEERSSNTRQNAEFSARMLDERRITHILLVTSAQHMARALALFEAQGLQVSPAPTDHESLHRTRWLDWVPDTDALDGSARAFKEVVGRWTGR